MSPDSQLTEAVSYKDHRVCRVCGSERLTPYLDLGMLPLSNNLATSATDPIHDQRYPLKVLLCEKCGLSQLSIVIPAEVLFGHYVYRSSISKGYVDHCHKMALQLRDRYGLTADSWHIDIAGNDGTLLRQFREVLGHHALNIDPATNLVPTGLNGMGYGVGCDQYGVQYYSVFWGMKAARHLKSVGWMADLITATNVFAHVADVKEFLQAVKLVLKPTGVLVLEFPYLVNFIQNGEFDTVYFEHLSYFSIYPLSLLCQDAGLTIMSVSRQDIHGGSVRVTIGYGKQDDTVVGFVQDERQNYSNIKRYYQFAEDVQLTILRFGAGIRELKNVAGFAASAKGNTLLNCAGIGVETIPYIIDETPEKQFKYSPGTRIPIVGIEIFLVEQFEFLKRRRPQPDYLVVLSWNFFEEIRDKCRAWGYKGKFIIPIPEFKIVE